jgi:hypothetical protein
MGVIRSAERIQWAGGADSEVAWKRSSIPCACHWGTVTQDEHEVDTTDMVVAVLLIIERGFGVFRRVGEGVCKALRNRGHEQHMPNSLRVCPNAFVSGSYSYPCKTRRFKVV